MNDDAAASRSAERACCLLAAAIIVAYAALLPRSRWQGDEYYILTRMRDGGWHFDKSWYLGWSPRLVSDLFYAGYGAAVNALHRPMAGSCMALLWIGLGCACILPALKAAGRTSGLLAGTSMFALFLLGHAITEVFYWPAGGLSYIPTIAGTVWLFWLLADELGRAPLRHAAAAVALVLIAGSSEFGIFAALCIIVCIEATQRIGGTQRGLRARQSLWMLPGLILALTDLALVLHGRVGASEGSGADAAILHHAGASLAAAVPHFLHDLAVPDFTGGAPANLTLSILSRILIFAAARWSLGHASSRTLPAFGVALLLAAFASVATAYYQFGRPCCQRHDTIRACFIDLALIALGAWSGSLRPVHRPNAASLAWAAAMLLLFLPALPAILADYRTMDQAMATHAQTWASGRSPGPDMVFVRDPQGQVINATGFTTGPAILAPDLVWYKTGILQFFGKQKMTVVDAAHSP